MNAAANDELIRLYKNRSVWLVQPDQNPAALEPYSSSPR
jgi:hypothetical protein